MTTLATQRHDSHGVSTRGRDSWKERAACKGMADDDSDPFYLDGLRGKRLQEAKAAAKAVCASCPVRRLCREEAMQRPERFGIWGGLTEVERGFSKR